MGKGGVEQGCDLCAHEVDLNEPLNCVRLANLPSDFEHGESQTAAIIPFFRGECRNIYI